MSSVLITGANGYLGSAVLRRLANVEGENVTALWRSNNDRLLSESLSNVRYLQCDLSDAAQVDRVFAESTFHTVIHTAAALPGSGERYMQNAVAGNITATGNIVTAAARSGCSRFIYCSSVSVYGTTHCPERGWLEDQTPLPSEAYGFTKFAGEELVRLTCGSQMQGTVLRLSGIHGEGRKGGAIFAITRAALANKKISVSNDVDPFQWIFLDDAVESIARIRLHEQETPCQYVNLASCTLSSLAELATKIVSYCGSNSLIESASIPIGRQVMSTEKAGQILGIQSVNDEGKLRALINWITEQPNAS